MFLSTGSYTFYGTNTTFSRKWSFTLDESYYARALVTYDFMWSNLNARILTPGDQIDNEFALGELGYNRNDLPLTQLPPGSYFLEIYEPLGSPSSTTARCVPFGLTIAFTATRGNASVAQGSVAHAGCPYFGLPATLNSLAGLSVFSNQTLRDQRLYLANVEVCRNILTNCLREVKLNSHMQIFRSQRASLLASRWHLLPCSVYTSRRIACLMLMWFCILEHK